jgi:hypothetical protein
VAFLFRYDHGVFIAGFMLLLLTLLHINRPRQWLAAVGSYIGLHCLVLLLPSIIYVQLTSGWQSFVQTNRTSAKLVGWRLRLMPPRIVVDRSMPLLAVHPFAERRLTIRWKASIDERSRRELESSYGLIDPVPARDDNAWNYGLTDARPETIGALGNDAAVDDVSGVSADDLAPSTGRWCGRSSTVTFPCSESASRPVSLHPQSIGGIQALGRYVWQCTTPADRLLVTGAFEPEIFFYAERPFAGGCTS